MKGYGGRAAVITGIGKEYYSALQTQGRTIYCRDEKNNRRAAYTPRRAAYTPRRATDVPRRAADAPRRAADVPRRAADIPRRAADMPRTLYFSLITKFMHCPCSYPIWHGNNFRASGVLVKRNKGIIINDRTTFKSDITDFSGNFITYRYNSNKRNCSVFKEVVQHLKNEN